MISITVIVAVDGEVRLRQVGITDDKAKVGELVTQLAMNHDVQSVLDSTDNHSSTYARAERLMSDLQAVHAMDRRMKIRDALSAFKAGRLRWDTFERRMEIQRAWLRAREKKR